MFHHCCPNTRHTSGLDHTIFVYSTWRIAAGEVISATHTKSLYSAMKMLAHLCMSRCFNCNCFFYLTI